MSQALQTAIDELIGQITAKEADIAPLKHAVNTLCRTLGQNPHYEESGLSQASPHTTPTASRKTIAWNLSQFFGRPLATCVAEIMETRFAAGLDKACSIDEVYASLKAGSYKFEGSSGNEENTKRAIKISLTKNTAQFVKLQDDYFSLKKWFGSSRSTAKKVKTSGSPEELEEATEADDALALTDGSEDDPLAGF